MSHSCKDGERKQACGASIHHALHLFRQERPGSYRGTLLRLWLLRWLGIGRGHDLWWWFKFWAQIESVKPPFWTCCSRDRSVSPVHRRHRCQMLSEKLLT